jgi:hypothetical protein
VVHTGALVPIDGSSARRGVSALITVTPTADLSFWTSAPRTILPGTASERTNWLSQSVVGNASDSLGKTM